MVADELARRADVRTWRQQYYGRFVVVRLGDKRVGLPKPTTYMNGSGRAVATAAAFYRVDAAELLVVHDELDLPFGRLRLKLGGGDAGHKGLQSVTRELGSSDYVRLRVGIGRPPEDFASGGADYVLQAFAPLEREVLPERIEAAADAVVLAAERGIAAAMNVTNRRDQ